MGYFGKAIFFSLSLPFYLSLLFVIFSETMIEDSLVVVVRYVCLVVIGIEIRVLNLKYNSYK